MFIKPFPKTKLNYFTDYCGEIEWNYSAPCSTWSNHPEVQKKAMSTLEEKRNEMYEVLIAKLQSIYKKK
jgi:hypothetical protein